MKTAADVRKEVQARMRAAQAQRIDEIKGHIEFCFNVLMNEKKLSLKDICNRTNLSLATVYHLYNLEVSDWIRMGTIQKLGKAAGVRLVLTEAKGSVSRQKVKA